MFDFDHLFSANLSHCIKPCVDYTAQHDYNEGTLCTGVAYINDICWRKNSISKYSAFYRNYEAVSAIMHLL